MPRSTEPIEVKRSSHQSQKGSISETARWAQEGNSQMLLYSYSSQTPQLITSFSYHCIFPNLPGVVEVVDEVLDNGCSVGGLDTLVVVGNDGARGGTGNNDTLLTLYPIQRD
jgi:hypothetical protein